MRRKTARLAAITSLLFISSCTQDISDEARRYVGLNEYDDRREIKNLVGVDPVRTEWCAAFVNAVLEIQNIPELFEVG